MGQEVFGRMLKNLRFTPKAIEEAGRMLKNLRFTPRAIEEAGRMLKNLRTTPMVIEVFGRMLENSRTAPRKFSFLVTFVGVGERKFHMQKKPPFLLGVQEKLIRIQPICKFHWAQHKS